MIEVVKISDCANDNGDYDVPIHNAIIIPRNATNGDVIKVLFGRPAREGKRGILYKFKYRNGKPMFSTYFDIDWWNTSYKTESEG